ncbi:MAG: hypothetical protein QXP04_04895, partial [Candidatus Nanoarchaeia archaeon]|nr:hypothetical protein [Candidatus Jingweiarchaeum tengchongense]
GAFLKEKRTATGGYVCEGISGPSQFKLDTIPGGGSKYKLLTIDGWSCVEENSYITLSKTGKFYNYIQDNFYTEDHMNLSFPYYQLESISVSCLVQVGVAGKKWPSVSTTFMGPADNFTLSTGGSGGCNDGCDWDDRLAGACIQAGIPGIIGITCPDGSWGDCILGNSQQTFNFNVNPMILEHIGDGAELPFSMKMIGSSKTCKHDDNPHMGMGFAARCNAIGYYPTHWKCSRIGEVYYFYNCTEDDRFSTFQGGRTFLDNNAPFSKLSNYLQSYYGTYSYNPVTQETQPAGNIQVPFFMLGQGPSFQDYEEAKKLCVPWKETIVNVSLGNTTFDPPFLTIPEKMEFCIVNEDKESHNVDVIDLSNQEVIRQFTFQSKQSACFKPSQGFYHVKDSNGDYAYLSVLKETGIAQVYVGRNIVPNYTVVTDEGFINFSLLERNEHNLTIQSINRFDNFVYEKNLTLNLSNPVETIRAPQTGEYKISDNSTMKTGFLFVQSPVQRFLFESNGSVDPNYEIYRPLGDLICFKSETEGLNISISRYTETEAGYEWVWLTNETLPTTSYCCIQGALPGKYQGITSDGRVANWTIGNGKPSATMTIQHIGFEPEELESPPGTKVCWVNPSAISRNINTKSSIKGTTFFSGIIPPLSDNVCWPTMNKTDSFVTRFVPDIGPQNIINIKEIETKNIQILQGGNFDTFSAIVKPGSQVCWVNNDKVNHTLRTENNAFITLQPSQVNCVEKVYVTEGSLFSRTILETNSTSYVGVIDGEGFMLSSSGPVPLNTFIELSEVNATSDGSVVLTKPHYFKIINKQNVPSELYEIYTVSLNRDSTSIGSVFKVNETETQVFQMPIKTFATVHLFVENRDTKNHTIDVGSDQIVIPSSSTYEFDVSINTTLTDLTIKQNLIDSGVTNQTIINVLSTIPVNVMYGEVRLEPESEITLQSPSEPLTSVMYENNTEKTITVSFQNTKDFVLENPLNNISLDLPTQVIHGDLSSQILYDMRKYADEGAMSLLIPSFHNVTV